MSSSCSNLRVNSSGKERVDLVAEAVGNSSCVHSVRVQKLNREDVARILFADSDSEGEYLPFGNDDRSAYNRTSPSETFESNDAAVQGESVHQAHTDTVPLSDFNGMVGGSDEHDRSVRRRSVGRASRGGRNRAGSSRSTSFPCRRTTRGRAVRARAGRRGRDGRDMNDADNGNDDGGWVYLASEERYQDWIKHFDEPVGYLGEKDLTSAAPIEFLSLFLNDDFWNLLTTETNRYAHQFLNSHQLTPNSRFHEWNDVTVSEIKAFLALHLCMGLVEKAEIEDYWAEFWPTYTPGFGKVMPRNRFQIILSFLHFANNAEYVCRGQPGHDRLFKVRPVIDLIVPRFSAIYGPLKELSLDEMTIAFKGKSPLKQYNPRKPDKYGYRVFVLSEATSGYVLQWSMYTGQNPDANAEADLGATHLIVRQLMAQYTGKGHEVYMDSYYTSPAIANELASEDTGLCGTVNCARRGMPRCLRSSELALRKGDDPVCMRNGKLLACAWHDTKRLTMLSSLHGNSCVRKLIRTKQRDTDFRWINRPVCVDRYNAFMGGVDTADQRMKTYIFPHRSRKWYNRIFNNILSISVVNSHVIYTKCTPGPHKSLKAFIQDIITDLLEGYSKREGKKIGRPSVEGREMPQRLTERHWLCAADDRPDCAVCSDRTRSKGRRQTKYRCSQCGVGLCAVPCFKRYHTVKNYKACHLDN